MPHHPDSQYLNLLSDIRDNGFDKGDRTGTGTRSVFGRQMRFDLTNRKIPLLTTKKVFSKGIIHELLWMLSGDTNVRYLKDHNVSIWDSWVLPETAEYVEMTLEERLKHPSARSLTVTNLTTLAPEQVHALLDIVETPRQRLVAGELPKIYQHQWRRWEQVKLLSGNEPHLPHYLSSGWEIHDEMKEGGLVIRREIDQIQQVIDQLKTNPDSRRIIVSAWNVGEIEEMALPPCHTLFQFWTRELSLSERLSIAQQRHISDAAITEATGDSVTERLDSVAIPRRALSCQLYMRSNDVPLGNPFNIVQYAILTHLLAQVTGMVAEEFIWTGGDVHVYQNQWDGIEEQLSRDPIENTARLELNESIDNLFDFTFDDIQIVDYQSHPSIKFPAAAV